MKLGTKGLMPGYGNQNVVRSNGVPNNVTVKAPKKLSTATDMSTRKPASGGNSIASKLRGPLTAGKSGGVIVT